jgi:hypothetical protein
MKPRIALAILGAVVVALGAIAFALVPPIAQPQSYHHFADTRALYGLPNAADVLSNAAFFVVAIVGLRAIASGRAVVVRPWERFCWLGVFGCALLIALGSAYYHVAPDDAHLVWDRLTIAIEFALLCGVIIGERGDGADGPWVTAALVVLAVVSVIVWHRTDDLRLYALVQILPAVVIPLAVVLLRPRYDRFAGYLSSAGLYALAKVLEMFDRPVYGALRAVSGHTLKHVAAAAAIGVLVPMLVKRRPRVAGPAGTAHAL